MFTCESLLFRKTKAFIALALLLALPFLGNVQRVSALQMNHVDRGMHASCASYCVRVNGGNPQQTIIDTKETKAPDPTPYEDETYCLQLRFAPLPRAPKPQEIFGLASFRPPNLVILYTNFRL